MSLKNSWYMYTDYLLRFCLLWSVIVDTERNISKILASRKLSENTAY